VNVEVIRSPKRRKTVQAREVEGVLHISIPANMTRAEEDHWVTEMVSRMERKRDTNNVDLDDRARRLARRYDLPLPTKIRWTDNQQWRWGSCSPWEGTVRISSKLAKEPAWVLDYVIVHELAHIAVANHNAEFWSLVDRYPKAERAKGFLIARGLETADDAGDLEGEPEQGTLWPVDW
jgi:predicted metal-dependent hydrolase